MNLRRQEGFTFLELLMSTVIIGILAIVVSEFYVQRLIDYARNDTLIILQSNTKQALEEMEHDVKSAKTIESTNKWTDPTGTTWTTSTGSPSTLVLSIPTLDSSDNLVFTDSSHTALQTNDLIYYVDSSKKTLWRRTIINPVCGVSVTCHDQTTGCSGCPPDSKVIEDVANLVVNYYDGNNASTTTVANVYSLDATLTQSRYKFGRTYSNSLTSRMTLRNKP
jgi:prepilin-type N-terminal cleavage/methylation domain-containing protein